MTTVDSCKRCSKDGLITIDHPLCIEEYNKYLGGVDLGMTTLQFYNHGTEPLLVEVIFHLLDVSTSNALALHNFTRSSPLSVVDFKTALVKGFPWDQIRSIPEVLVEHMPFRTEDRFCCACCSLFNSMR